MSTHADSPRRAWSRPWPLRMYFALLFVLLVGIAVFRVAYLDHEGATDAREEAARDADYSANAAAKQLGEYLTLLQTTTQSLGANPQIAQVLASPEQCTLTFSGIGGADRSHLDLLRADGTVACSSQRDAASEDGGYGQADWFQRALREPLLLAPVRDPRTGAPVVLSTTPMPDGQGVVAGFADLAPVAPTLAAQHGGGRPSEFLLTTRDGRTVISRSLAPRRWSGQPLPPGGLGTDIERADFDGTDRLYAQSAVPKLAWNVHVGEDLDAVLASVERQRTRQLVIAAVTLALFLLAAGLVYARVAAPIRRLSAAVGSTRVSETPTPVPVSGPAEVTSLAQDVNALIASVNSELAERRKAEVAAHESEERYRLLFEQNPRPMWVYEVGSLRFLAVNDAAVHAYGYSRDEFLAMTIEGIRPAEESERLHAHVDGRALEDVVGLQHAGIWRHRHKDGSLFDVEVTSHDHVFDGRPARVVLALDVTERMMAERALRHSEARYRELFDKASDLIATMNVEGRLTAVNEAFALATGYRHEELIGMPLDDLVPAPSRELVAQARERTLLGGAPKLYEHELIASDGSRIQVEVASRLIEEDGRPVGVESICRDISERRRLEEELRQAQRLEAVGRLAGGIAHDFNNLLTVIGGYAEMLLARNGDAQAEVQQISAAADRAAVLTRQLLAFSRRQVLQPRVLQLNDVVGGLTSLLQRLIGEDVELVATLAPNLEPVRADPSQMEQVLLNLAVNARDAMPGGGQLTIQTANVHLDEEYVSHHGEVAVGPHVMLAVTDDGVGMEPSVAEHIFEPFFTTKPVGTGTGLGLATVYGIVKQSGGSIWVYSEPGAGTTFKIYLPVVQAPIDEDRAPEPRPAVARGTETVLLAEDNTALRQLIAHMLESNGYEVLAAQTPTDAVRLARDASDRISLLISDLVMPEMNGSTLATKVSDLVPGVRVLLMSGYTDEAVARSGSLAPGAEYLEKPFGAEELAARVRETLDSE
jgi:two-component system, cell cycle sensor histidine kinase and response regulator CckA